MIISSSSANAYQSFYLMFSFHSIELIVLFGPTFVAIKLRINQGINSHTCHQNGYNNTSSYFFFFQESSRFVHCVRSTIVVLDFVNSCRGFIVWFYKLDSVLCPFFSRRFCGILLRVICMGSNVVLLILEIRTACDTMTFSQFNGIFSLCCFLPFLFLLLDLYRHVFGGHLNPNLKCFGVFDKFWIKTF